MKKIVSAAILTFLVFAVLLFAGCAGGDDTGDPSASGNAVQTDGPEVTAVPATEAPTPTAAPTEAPTEDPNVTPKPKLVNVALNKPATANYTEEASNVFGPEAVVDGDETTRWSGFDLRLPNYKTELVHFVDIDLQGRFVLKEFSILWETLTGYYRIQVSDTGEDESWTTVYSSEDYATYSASPIDDFEIDLPNGTEANYVRIITDVPEDYVYADHPFCSIYEFELLGYAAAE